MTQPQHCDHECVCSKFRWDQQEGGLPCIKADCTYDTRSRPHTSTQDKRVPYVEVIRDTLYNDADRAMVMIMFLCSFGFAWGWGYLKCH